MYGLAVAHETRSDIVDKRKVDGWDAKKVFRWIIKRISNKSGIPAIFVEYKTQQIILHDDATTFVHEMAQNGHNGRVWLARIPTKMVNIILKAITLTEYNVYLVYARNLKISSLFTSFFFKNAQKATRCCGSMCSTKIASWHLNSICQCLNMRHKQITID